MTHVQHSVENVLSKRRYKQLGTVLLHNMNVFVTYLKKTLLSREPNCVKSKLTKLSKQISCVVTEIHTS